MNTLIRGLSAVCIGTCLTQLILLAYFAAQGTINGSTLTKVVALMNGIDISGERLQRILQENDDQELPNYDEVLEARKLRSLDMDLRLWSQGQYRSELANMLADLSNREQRFDARREAYDRRMLELQEDALKTGGEDVQRIMQELSAEKAKDQLVRMFKDERIDDVVNYVKGLPSDKRKDIMAEFETDEENDTLYEIIRHIGEGLPMTSLIEQARNQD